MQKYNSNCTSRTNWFDLAGTHCTLSEPEPLNAFKSIEGLLNTEVDNICLPAYFGNNQILPSLGIITGQKPPHTEEAWILTTQYSEIAGLGIGAPIPGLTVT
jgi:hypothetical protein